MNRLKKLSFLLLIFCIQCNTQQEQLKVNNDITTTYFLIRHAEKDTINPDNKDPKLIDIGNQRAKKWAKIISNTPIDMVFSTKYSRTIETATPIAELHNIPINYYNPNQLYDHEFQQQTKGKTCVIVGHSNTTPAFVNKIIQQEKYKEIHHDDYGKLYIINISNNIITDTSLSID